MIKSESIAKLIPALIKAKAKFAPAVKNKKNDFFKSKYVPLDMVIEVTESALSSEGLAVVQTTLAGPEQESVLITSLIHESGEFIEGHYFLKSVKDDPQGHGSAMTYGRRYCLMAILGIAPEDDDGNAASHAGNPAAAVTFAKTPAEKVAAKVAQAEAKLLTPDSKPQINVDDKQAAATAYKMLQQIEPELAAQIKHKWGTNYIEMKADIEASYREVLEGAK